MLFIALLIAAAFVIFGPPRIVIGTAIALMAAATAASAGASAVGQNKQNKDAESAGRPKHRQRRKVQLAVNDALDRRQRALTGMATMAFNWGSMVA